MHHAIVLDLTWLHGWSLTLEYDIQQREIALHNMTHDLQSIDIVAFTLIVARLQAPLALSKHLSADCWVTTTTAGKNAAALNSKSKTVLLGPGGQSYYFNWACTLSCTYGSQCNNYHGCSLCQDKGHWARHCRGSCWVVTLLDPRLVKAPLCKYGLLCDWKHVVKGLNDGFDVGICESLSHTHMFQKSQLFLPWSIVHKFVHSQ